MFRRDSRRSVFQSIFNENSKSFVFYDRTCSMQEAPLVYLVELIGREIDFNEENMWREFLSSVEGR